MSSVSQPAEARTLLFVVGMHRSGTSALCAALRACGVTFGEQLLAPMAGVNDEGFWEDAEVVAANEALLSAAGAHWYSLALPGGEAGWPAAALAHFREQAGAILQRGFGPGRVQAVKDPRFCITLPLWLEACAELGVKAQVCTASRAPLEVAQSLQRRDGFPLGYGLRLDLAYRKALAPALPSGSLAVSFPELVEDPVKVMLRLAESVPLETGPNAVAMAVRGDLRHHSAPAASEPLTQPVLSGAELPALEACIERHYPTDAMLAECVTGFVTRGAQLTAVGDAHSLSLETIAAKDEDINALAAEHREALATIAERDQQIFDLDSRLQGTGEWLERALATIEERDAQVAELDRRLAEIGGLHSHALEVIAEKDREIADIYAVPVIGLALRGARRYRRQ